MFLELFKGRISFLTQGPTGRSEVTSLCGGGGALNTSLYTLLESPLSTNQTLPQFKWPTVKPPVPYLPGLPALGPHSRFSSRFWNCSKVQSVDLTLLLPSAGTRPSAQGRHSQCNFLGNTVHVHRTHFSRNALKSLTCELGTV